MVDIVCGGRDCFWAVVRSESYQTQMITLPSKRTRRHTSSKKHRLNTDKFITYHTIRCPKSYVGQKEWSLCLVPGHEDLHNPGPVARGQFDWFTRVFVFSTGQGKRKKQNRGELLSKKATRMIFEPKIQILYHESISQVSLWSDFFSPHFSGFFVKHDCYQKSKYIIIYFTTR